MYTYIRISPRTPGRYAATLGDMPTTTTVAPQHTTTLLGASDGVVLIQRVDVPHAGRP